jgi:PAS domain S-box-containing protein
VTVAFCLLIGLLISVGWLALDQMSRIEEKVSQMLGREWAKVKVAREAVALSTANNRITLSLFLLNDTNHWSPLLAERAENTRRISEFLQRIERQVNSPEERRMLEAVKEARGPYVASYLEAIKLKLDRGETEAARSIMIGRTMPLLTRYHESWNRLIEFQQERMDAVAGVAATSYARTRAQMLGLVVLSVVGACFIAAIVTKSSAKETAERQKAQNELRRAGEQLETRVAERTRELELEIGERKRSEDTLRLFRALVDQTSDAVEVLDPETGRYLDANEVAWRGLGYSREELLALSVLQVDPRIGQEGFAQLGKRLRESGPVTIRSEHRRKDGSVFPVEVSARYVEYGQGYLVAVARDITERIHLELQLRQAQKLEAVGQLAAGIAHEINTPMQYIGDNVRFLQESFREVVEVLESYRELARAAATGPVGAAQLQSLNKKLEASDLEYLLLQIPQAIAETLEGAQRAAKIVRAMKEFSHPGTKEKIPADLNHAIETTATVARHEWKYVAELQLELDPELPPVPCFVGEFNQAILNLLVNAAHAIGDAADQHAGSKGLIKVTTCQKGHQVEVRISDSGTGIPEAVRSRIFEPFFTTKPVGKGTGQGLSIVYGCIVKRHGGTVSFESEVGKGTTFILRIPLTPDGEAAHDLSRPSPHLLPA